MQAMHCSQTGKRETVAREFWQIRQSDGNKALYKLPSVEFSSEARNGRSGVAGTPLARIRSPLLLKTTSLHAGISGIPAGNVG